MSDVTEKQLEDMEALLVQTAASMTSDRDTSTLHGLSPSRLYFADRPQREVGHMSTDHFVATWAAGDNSFADNPPNVVLSFAEPSDRLPEDTVGSSRTRTWTATLSPTPSSSWTAPYPPPPDHAHCSSTRSGVPSHQSPQPACTAANAAGCAKDPTALAGRETTGPARVAKT